MHKKPDTRGNNRKKGFAEDVLEVLIDGMKKLKAKGWIFFLFTLIVTYEVLQHWRGIGDMLGTSKWVCLLILFLPFMTLVISSKFNSGDKNEDEIFRSIGLTNSLGETPELISKEKDKKNPRIEIRTYDSQSIAVEDWLNKRNQIEAAFNCSVVFTERSSKSKQKVLLGVISGEYSIPTNLEWEDDLTPGFNYDEDKPVQKQGKIAKKLEQMNQVEVGNTYINGPDKGFSVVLGESITGPLTVDIDSEPHMIIGGTTGSGKSVLLRSVLWQCVLKGARPYIIDFKGGVEFGDRWEEFATIYTDRPKALALLNMLQLEMDQRYALFKRSGCKNLIGYNQANPHRPLSRIILACDEVASMLNSKGATKEDKQDLNGINKVLMELAQKGRAAGINMILATQRPDAETLPGQIRSNLPVRICGQVGGKAGLSEIVLDDPIAATISQRQKGRFYTNIDGMTEFQGYLFIDSKHITSGNYQSGGTLVLDGLPESDHSNEVDEEQAELEKELEAGTLVTKSPREVHEKLMEMKKETPNPFDNIKLVD